MVLLSKKLFQFTLKITCCGKKEEEYLAAKEHPSDHTPLDIKWHVPKFSF